MTSQKEPNHTQRTPCTLTYSNTWIKPGNPKPGTSIQCEVKSVISPALWLSNERHLCCLSRSLIKIVCLQLNGEISIPRAKACTLFKAIEETNTSIESVMRNPAIRKQRVFTLGRSYLVWESKQRLCSWESELHKD